MKWARRGGYMVHVPNAYVCVFSPSTVHDVGACQNCYGGPISGDI